jgi:ABC-type nitrate/sulfonate/bicarbonate transport system substrate-binding protein
VLYEILRQAGLDRTDYAVREVGAPRHRFEAMRTDKAMAAAILNPPFAMRARRAGLTDLGAVVDRIGPYQGTVPYVLRSWAQVNREVLVAYLAACIEGLHWALDPAHRTAAVALLAQRLELPDDIAAETYAVAVDANRGLTSDAALDRAGFATMLRLRALATGAKLHPPERYVDLSYLQQALAVAG